MTDRTPHGGERHTPEDLLDALLAGSRNELLDTMTTALDTDAGLRALAPLRTGPLANIKKTTGRAVTLEFKVFKVSVNDDAPVLEEGPHQAIELIADLLAEIEDVLMVMSGEAEYACAGCANVLTALMDGLEDLRLTRGDAMELVDEAHRFLDELRVAIQNTEFQDLDSFMIEEWAESLQMLRGVVIRMFDDAHDSITIEN
ncbi:hypothetical protein ACWF94_10990 [Streptomyces sp. NPDC055078]